MFKVCLDRFEMELSLIDAKAAEILLDIADEESETPKYLEDALFEVTTELYCNGKLQTKTVNYNENYCGMLCEASSARASSRGDSSYRCKVVQTRAGCVDF
jgi:hypothetical protein